LVVSFRKLKFVVPKEWIHYAKGPKLKWYRWESSNLFRCSWLCYYGG